MRKNANAEHPAQCARMLLFAVLVLAATPPSDAVAGGLSTRQIVTTYTYNPDGALTAITISGDEADTKTTYVTWDDFIPDAGDPRTGTTMVGHGTLAAIGPTPGLDSADARFDFDARDRLTSASVGGLTETYEYHADRELASSSVGDDTLRFYQNEDHNAEITNIYHENADLWDAYVGGARYLSDGGEQILLKPRKDTACTYDPAAETIQSYAYDTFGSQPRAMPQAGYDLSENPFQYTGEYRDPIWGGVYLRARWYHPDLPLFISRDPKPNLNRYAYTGGNPVMRTDPEGMRFHSPGQFFRAANAFLNAGVRGHFDRIFLAPVMSLLQIAADPKAFWKQIETDKDGIDIFLAASVVSQFGFMGAEGAGYSVVFRNLSMTTRVVTRLAVDASLDVAQSVAVGADRGFHHFDQGAFWQSIELSVGSLGWDRGLGKGVNPFTLTGEDVARHITELSDNNTVLIFRERVQGYSPMRHTSPLQEWKHVGNYHERIVAVSKQVSASNELVYAGPKNEFAKVRSNLVHAAEGTPIEDIMRGSRSRFQLVGTAQNFQMSEFLQLNPRGILGERDAFRRANWNQWDDVPKSARYGMISNNCQDHAAAVLGQLEFQ